MATYIGVALYIILYLGYSLYERFVLGRLNHFVPTSEVDFVTDAVWAPGDGDVIREHDKQERKSRRISLRQWFKHVY